MDWWLGISTLLFDAILAGNELTRLHFDDDNGVVAMRKANRRVVFVSSHESCLMQNGYGLVGCKTTVVLMGNWKNALAMSVQRTESIRHV